MYKQPLRKRTNAQKIHRSPGGPSLQRVHERNVNFTFTVQEDLHCRLNFLWTREADSAAEATVLKHFSSALLSGASTTHSAEFSRSEGAFAFTPADTPAHRRCTQSVTPSPGCFWAAWLERAWDGNGKDHSVDLLNTHTHLQSQSHDWDTPSNTANKLTNSHPTPTYNNQSHTAHVPRAVYLQYSGAPLGGVTETAQTWQSHKRCFYVVSNWLWTLCYLHSFSSPSSVPAGLDWADDRKICFSLSSNSKIICYVNLFRKSKHLNLYLKIHFLLTSVAW